MPDHTGVRRPESTVQGLRDALRLDPTHPNLHVQLGNLIVGWMQGPYHEVPFCQTQ